MRRHGTTGNLWAPSKAPSRKGNRTRKHWALRGCINRGPGQRICCSLAKYQYYVYRVARADGHVIGQMSSPWRALSAGASKSWSRASRCKSIKANSANITNVAQSLKYGPSPVLNVACDSVPAAV